MHPTFNLLDQPWIRVAYADGPTREVSLLELFADAQRISTISGEIASQDVAILRFLLAITIRATAVAADMDTWQDYWEGASSLQESATKYLEEHRDRFDLLHPEYPFYQVAGLHSAAGRIYGLEKIIADVPNGSQLFTTRRGAGIESISWAEAARWLVHVHAFDAAGIRPGAVGDPLVSGGKSFPIGPAWNGQIGTAYVQGDSLAKTLLLNSVVYSEVRSLESVQFDLDLPPWERPADGPGATPGIKPTGPVSCYTWQSRRIFIHGNASRATGVFLSNGDKATPQNRFSVEPMTAWRYSDPQTKKAGKTTFMPRKYASLQGLWRSLPAFVNQLSPRVRLSKTSDIEQFRNPGVVEFYRYLISVGIAPNNGLIPLHATGIEYGPQEAVIEELVDGVISLPSSLVADDPNVTAAVRSALTEADSTAFALRNFAANLDRASGGDPDTIAAAGDRARASAYGSFDQMFPRWLTDLSNSDPAEALAHWRRLLHREAQSISEQLVTAVPPTAFAGRGKDASFMDVSKALAFFAKSMRTSVPNPDSPTEPKERNEA